MTSADGELRLGHILNATGLTDAEVLCIRHTFTPNGLHRDSTLRQVLDYTRRQSLRPGKIPADPPRVWLVFMADGGRRSRFLTAYDNYGELRKERTEIYRVFDLRESQTVSALRNRLVIDWPDPINWVRHGKRASEPPVVEIADPQVVTFPGFDRVLISYNDLQALVEDARWSQWRIALATVQGIYLIADTSTGQLYVGKADGRDRILGRWTAYARDGHGGNVAMKMLAGLDPTYRENLMFSILRVFGPEATTKEVDEAENHFKRALLTKQYGLNRN